MKPTSIDQLKTYAEGQVVQLPNFSEGQTFFARLRRPSMLALAKSGKIPNALLQTANKLFGGKGVDEKKNSAMSELFQILDIVCDACFVEPTYSQIKEAGIELTDEQYMFIFNYTQTGVKALEQFRQQSINVQPAVNGSQV